MKKIIKYKVKAVLFLFSIAVLASCTDQEKDYVGDPLVTYPDITVTNVAPLTGRPQTPITITGTNFGDYKEAAHIYFNGALIKSTDIISYSNNQIVVKVPANASSGPIKIQVWNHEVTVDGFTFIPGAVISSLSPSSGIGGDIVTISGKNFGTDPSKITVLFGGTPSPLSAEIVSVADDKITVKVPNGVPPGGTTGGVTGSLSITVYQEVLTGPAFTYLNPSTVYDEFGIPNTDIVGTIPQNHIGTRAWVTQNPATKNNIADGTSRLILRNGIISAYDVSNNTATSYVQQNKVTLSTVFNVGTVAQDNRDYRGVLIGFYSAIGATTDPATANFRGLIIDPNGRVSFWNADSTSPTNTAGATQKIDYQGTWDKTKDHTLSLSVDRVTGNFISVIIDGKSYAFNSTTAFAGANAKYIGFASWTATNASFVGYIDRVEYYPYIP